MDASEPTFNPDARVEVIAIYGQNTKRGLVVMSSTDGQGNTMVTQHTPAKAREIAAFLVEAAGAAEGDEALMLVLDEMDADDQMKGGFLGMLREKRALIDQRSRAEARRAVAFDQGDPEEPS